MLRRAQPALYPGTRYLKQIGLLDRVRLINERVDRTVYLFAIINVYSVLGVDSDAEVHIRALLDIFDIPYVIAELRNGRLDELTDGACRSLRTVFCH